MSDFRENYFEAREIIAKELIQKYNLIESYKDDNRLTLDSNTHSIHLTFYIPDGDDVFLTKKGDLPSWETSFYSYLLKTYPNDDLRKLETAKLFKPISHFEQHNFSIERLRESFNIQVHFLLNFFFKKKLI